jgi:hypothetical protein
MHSTLSASPRFYQTNFLFQPKNYFNEFQLCCLLGHLKKDKIAILLPQVGDESGKYVNPTFPVFEPISIRI